MRQLSDWQAKDRRYVWHPFTQQQTAADALLVKKAQGAYLHLGDGRVLIDAISSWWVNLHGHCHPYVMDAIKAQCDELEQVMFAGFTHERAITLAERLVGLLPPGFSRIFYSDNGSTAVEVALKMAMQYWYNRGEPRYNILALAGAYHGDTFGAMTVSAKGGFTAAFKPFMVEKVFTIDAPARGGDRQALLKGLAELLAKHGSGLAAFIYEPLVQGAGGMQMHDAATLDAMLAMVKDAGVLCIADEVMTGFGRTGSLFASDQLQSKPDLMCLAKGLTGGVLPLSVTACREEIYEAFLAEDTRKAFFHGHSFTANALGCAAACASLDLLQSEPCLAAIERITASHQEFRRALAGNQAASAFTNVRQQGTILALDIVTPDGGGYFNQIGRQVAPFFAEAGVLVRPLGNVIYLLPPYCVSEADLKLVYEAIEKFGLSLVG